jgi:hypothetical protein
MVATWALVLASLVVSEGCAPGKDRVDKQTRDILANADKVEVYRVASGKSEKPPKPTDGRKISGFPVISQGKNQGKEFARKLGAILVDKQMHENTAKCFWPGVAFRVWRGDKHVDVLICFKCDNFYAGPPVGKAREIGGFDGTPLRSRLLRLAKDTFPEDKDIQGLQDK